MTKQIIAIAVLFFLIAGAKSAAEPKSDLVGSLQSEATIPAEPVWKPLPSYPKDALARHIEGRVMLRLTISYQGHISKIAVATSSGHDVLDNAALDAVRYWHFEPAKQNGTPVDWSAIQPVRFRID